MDAYRGVAVRVPATGQAAAAVLVLHGGYEHGIARPGRLNPPARRMHPFIRAIAGAARDRDLVVAEARYRHRGWNGERADTARDAARALEELAALTGGAPVVMVGHSMGARAALRTAGTPTVAGVVALAAWCPPDEPVAHLGGARLVFVHARGDRITSPAASLAMAGRARAAGAQVARYEFPRGDHAMLRGAARWHRLTARAVCGLLGFAPLPSGAAQSFALPAASADGLTLPPG
ncbi:alpha/beta fold hydrolase [Streptomyces sp. V4-01]|uniref:Alpha/beta fold hydrolase n=1 Tax=Actinacidiphila polyblastidii TaxID=3110430 RepID=A0ABU7P6K5_9ACTN|nr:alpha/beta fold hydrolase [Streptomyces sp. V4-01]